MTFARANALRYRRTRSTPLPRAWRMATCGSQYEQRKRICAPRMISGSVKTVCPYCGVGCGMVLQVESGQVVKVSGDKEHPANFGRLCTKGSSAHVVLRKSGRLECAFIRHERD